MRSATAAAVARTAVVFVSACDASGEPAHRSCTFAQINGEQHVAVAEVISVAIWPLLVMTHCGSTVVRTQTSLAGQAGGLTGFNGLAVRTAATGVNVLRHLEVMEFYCSSRVATQNKPGNEQKA